MSEFTCHYKDVCYIRLLWRDAGWLVQSVCLDLTDCPQCSPALQSLRRADLTHGASCITQLLCLCVCALSVAAQSCWLRRRRKRWPCTNLTSAFRFTQSAHAHKHTPTRSCTFKQKGTCSFLSETNLIQKREAHLITHYMFKTPYCC